MVYIYKIDYEQIRYNILQLYNSDYLVLKSNAYGFGFKKVLDIAYGCNMKKYCVLDINDAIYIKRKYRDTIVLILGPLNKKHLNLYEKYQIHITITEVDDLQIIKYHNILYQVEINSGMNRFGLNDINYEILKMDKRFKGIYSHNATTDIFFINEQAQYFFDIAKSVVDKETHFASSGTKDLKLPFTNARRIGCDIYKNSLTVYGKIIQINFCKKDSYLGYDYSYKFNADSYIGVIDIGYADGLERNCAGFMVYINGSYYPLIAKACMNHSFVLLDSKCKKNEEVIFIGLNNIIDNYINYFKKIPHEIYLNYLKNF